MYCVEVRLGDNKTVSSPDFDFDRLQIVKKYRSYYDGYGMFPNGRDKTLFFYFNGKDVFQEFVAEATKEFGYRLGVMYDSEA